MSLVGVTKLSFVALTALSLSAYSLGAHVKVNCNKNQTISAALKLLNPDEPNTVTVSGHCKENVLIQSFDRLTLITTSGAKIADASGGTAIVVDIEDSRVNLQGFTITGGADGVVCATGSICHLTANTVQSSVGDEAVIVDSSQAFLTSNIIQNNADRGLTDRNGSQVSSSSDIFRGNGGLTGGAITVISAGLVAGVSTVKNNRGVGILAAHHATVRLFSCTITGNAADGVALRSGSSRDFENLSGPTTVTGNGGSGVSLGDLSFGKFSLVNITGNLGGTDVLCNPQFSATRGALTDINGGTTNCVEPASKGGD